MRPTVSEQLDGSARLLETIVAPAVGGTDAEGVVHEVIRNLRMLESAWPRVVPFLQWDNEATLDLLLAATDLPAELANRVDQVRSAGPTESWDHLALQDRNDRLRDLLIQVIAAADEVSDDIRGHLLTRAKRYPMRTVPRLSPSNSEGSNRC